MLSLMIPTLIIVVLNASWKTLLFLIDLIDSGEEEANSFSTDNTVHYNYRTGDVDPIKRIDGLYNK